MIIQKGKYNFITRLIIAILALGFFYYSYRYVFQYNSESTSPSYRDTPTFLKFLKYPVMLLIYGYAIVKFKWDKINWIEKTKVTHLLMSIFCCYLLFHTAILFDFETLKIFFVSLIPFLFLLHYKSNVNLYAVCRFLSLFYIFSIAYEIIQLLLFFLIGRLPALAYENSISVRFGGPWDDPNGWGIALSFFIPFSYFYYRRKLFKQINFLTGIIMLVLTQSLTAIGSFLLSYILYNCLLGGRKRWAYVAFMLIFLMCGVFLGYALFGSFFTDYVSMKQGSIDSHAGSIDTFLSFQWYNYIIGLDKDVFNESDIVNILCYGGIPLLLIWLLIIVIDIICIRDMIWKKPNCPSFWKASLYYQISFFVAQFNLPCTRMFYLYVLFNILLCITVYYRMRRIRIVLVS